MAVSNFIKQTEGGILMAGKLQQTVIIDPIAPGCTFEIHNMFFILLVVDLAAYSAVPVGVF